MTKVLFLCSQNRLRSPTAETIFSRKEGIQVASAGLESGATRPVTDDLISWADIVFVMDRGHLNKLRKRLGRAYEAKRVICLNIPDEFEFMDPDLVKLLEARVSRYLP